MYSQGCEPKALIFHILSFYSGWPNIPSFCPASTAHLDRSHYQGRGQRWGIEVQVMPASPF